MSFGQRLLVGSIGFPALLLTTQSIYMMRLLILVTSLGAHYEFTTISSNIVDRIIQNTKNKVFLKKMTNSKTMYLTIFIQQAILYYEPINEYLILQIFMVICAYFLLRLAQLLHYLNSNQLNDELMFMTLTQIGLDIVEYILYYQGLNYLLYLMHFQHFTKFVIFWLCMTFQSDNGALFLGKLIGRTKLCQIVSPNKTVEGLYGAIILPMLSALMFKLLQDYQIFAILGDIDSNHLIWMTIIISIGSISGDFVESFIKRVSKVKDSSNLFPGHGGLLDRMDSMGLSVPGYFIYIKYFIELTTIYSP